MSLNWSALSFSPLTRNEITLYVKDAEWQDFRRRLLLTRLPVKYAALEEWLEEHSHNRASQVQVTNFVNALRRGGLIK